MNDFDAYQKSTNVTIKYPTQPNERAINYCILGLVGESGEIAEKWKKVIRDENGQLSDEKIEEMGKELGDVLWYLARTADHLGLSLGDIAMKNLEKLADRQVRGMIGGSGDNR